MNTFKFLISGMTSLLVFGVFVPKIFAEPPVITDQQILESIGIDQNLNQQIPMDLTFNDETGTPRLLSEYFGNKPVILVPVYYKCPMLCSLVLNGLLDSLKLVSLQLGKDYEVITFSISPDEDAQLARNKKITYLQSLNRPGDDPGWKFLTGNEENIKALTKAIGFRYAKDPKTGEYAHAAALVIVTPTGKISRYLTGIEFAPRDVKLALIESSHGKIGSPLDRLLLFCYHYDPLTGKYGLAIKRVMRAGALLTVIVLGWFIVTSLKREKNKQGVR